MQTKIIKINEKNPKKSNIDYCAKIILSGGLVAFPTETVYGLGANVFDEIAVKKIFIAKGRPQDNPLIAHISHKDQVNTLAKQIPIKAKLLIDKFWPGPLTIVLKKQPIVPNIVTANGNTVAIRMPNNKIALELIKASGVPIVAPSANISGKPSPTTAKHVIDDMNSRIDAIIVGNNTDIGIESTVIDLTKKTPIILRPGKITKEQIEKIIGKINTHNSNNKIKKVNSPGMKYKHYAPNADVIIIDTKKDMDTKIKELKEKNKSIAIISLKNNYTSNHTKINYKAKTITELTKNIFKKFRDFDKKNIDTILVEKIDEKGLGIALMNRIKKAASKK